MDFKTVIYNQGQKAINYLVDCIDEFIDSDLPLHGAAMHYPKSGGKGFRPAMLQLVCSALGGDSDKAIPVAAAIEAIHVSSLVHDDFMDGDETRRGVPAVWKKWDPNMAIISGDVLFSISMAIAGDIEGLDYKLKFNFTKHLAKVYIKLCHGQTLDIEFTKMPLDDLTIDRVKEMQYLKTGVLFEFACVTGARIALSKWDDDIIEQVREYAKLAGTAFQMQDDIIGLVGDSDVTGKPVGSDIREGKRTLIAIHAYSNANPEQKQFLKKVLGNKDASQEDIEQCMKVMTEIGSIAYSKSLAEEMASKAKNIANQLPVNESSKVLEAFATYMIERKL